MIQEKQNTRKNPDDTTMHSYMIFNSSTDPDAFKRSKTSSIPVITHADTAEIIGIC